MSASEPPKTTSPVIFRSASAPPAEKSTSTWNVCPPLTIVDALDTTRADDGHVLEISAVVAGGPQSEAANLALDPASGANGIGRPGFSAAHGIGRVDVEARHEIARRDGGDGGTAAGM